MSRTGPRRKTLPGLGPGPKSLVLNIPNGDADVGKFK
jgi:hypothetical protein